MKIESMPFSADSLHTEASEFFSRAEINVLCRSKSLNSVNLSSVTELNQYI